MNKLLEWGYHHLQDRVLLIYFDIHYLWCVWNTIDVIFEIVAVVYMIARSCANVA